MAFLRSSSRALMSIAVTFLVVVMTVSCVGVDAAPLNAERSTEALVRRLRAGVPVDATKQEILARASSPLGLELRHAAQSNGELTCAACENYVGLIMTIMADPALVNATEAASAVACEKAYANNTASAAVCTAVAKYIIHALPKLIQKLVDKSWDVPFNLCAILFDNVCTNNCCSSNYAPEQVYISLADGSDFSSMRVTWVTLKEAPGANVVYQLANGGAAQTAAAQTSRTYTFAGWIGVVNTAVMTGLTANTTYSYTVGADAYNRSQSFSFTTFPANIGTPERPLKILYIADMSYGPQSDFTVQRVGERVRSGEVDMIIHNGDISYADGFMLHWDMFMRKISPTFAPYVPYLVNPGNHEIEANFSSYRTRLAQSMPKDASTLEGAMYYSLNIGPTRILMMDSETPVGTGDIPEAEVAWANGVLSSQDRKAQPWSLVFHHRPLYCDEDSTDCTKTAFLLRLQAESTYIKNKVDLVGTGHVHYYLRSYPLAMGEAAGNSYASPTAPVYVVNGAAGNHGPNLHPSGTQPKLYPVGVTDIGYGIMTISSDFANNKHQLVYDYYEARNDTRLDTFTITKAVN